MVEDGEIERNGTVIRIDDTGSVQIDLAAGETVEFTGDDTGTNATRTSYTGDALTIDGVSFDEKADLTGAGGVLLSSQVPSLSITETFTVADEAARLALDVQEGDVAIQQDNSKTYIFTGGDPSVATNWSLIVFDVLGAIDGEQITPSDISATTGSVATVPSAPDDIARKAETDAKVDDSEFPTLQINGVTVDSTDTIDFVPE